MDFTYHTDTHSGTFSLVDADGHRFYGDLYRRSKARDSEDMRYWVYINDNTGQRAFQIIEVNELDEHDTSDTNQFRAIARVVARRAERAIDTERLVQQDLGIVA